MKKRIDRPGGWFGNAKILLLLALASLPRPAAAQEMQALATPQLLYRYENASASYQPLVRLFWKIELPYLHFRQNEKGQFLTRITGRIVLSDSLRTLSDTSFALTHFAPGPGLEADPLTGSFARLTPDHPVTVRLSLAEPGIAGSSWSDSFRLVPASVAGRPFHSDALFVDSAGAPLYSDFIDAASGDLRAYSECYNTASLPPGAFPLVRAVWASSKPGGPALFSQTLRDTLRQPASFIASSDRVRVALLHSGNYYLNTELRDARNVRLSGNATFFQLSNPSPADAPAAQPRDTSDLPQASYLNLATTFLAKYNLSQIREMLEMIRPVSDGSGVAVIDGLLDHPEENYMRYYLYNYFAKLNPEHPGDAWKAYSQKVIEVNRLFGGMDPGYITDRGIVYLKYGKPDDRVIVNSEPGSYPYEVWQYYALGKRREEGVFLFYQPNGMVRNYKVLHSTVNGEFRNPQWRQYIYRNPEATTSSRAEELIRNR